MADEDISYDESMALVVVDVQNDFVDPRGSLAVAGGERVVEPINGHIADARAAGATVVVLQDWHPAVTPHFTEHGGTWPVHCVRNTWGAELHPGLSNDVDVILRKGTGGEDGYSGFTVRDQTGKESPTGLTGILRERGVEHVVIVGIASDVCVKATALDANASGFTTTTLWSLTRPVELSEGDSAAARAELVEAGVEVVGQMP